MKNVKLKNGSIIPAMCMGTDILPDLFFASNKIKEFINRRVYQGKRLLKGEYRIYKRYKGIIECTNKAISCGCNFFDTSRAYGSSEKMLARALTGVARDTYYICTKLSNEDQLMGKSAMEALKESMHQLKISYVDIYMLHWPVAGKFLEYWKQLEELYEEGLCKAIGVANCKIHHLEEIKSIARIMPMVNEVECHPLLSENELRNYCRENNIQVMAYTSTARQDFRLKASRRMKSVCDRTHKNLAQVILRWHIQNNVIPIFNTSSLQHLISNMEALNFELSEEDMQIIDSMNINARTRYDSDNCEWDRL